LTKQAGSLYHCYALLGGCIVVFVGAKIIQHNSPGGHSVQFYFGQVCNLIFILSLETYELINKSSDATAIWVNMPLETSFSIPLETEKTSDSAALIFFPLFITFDRQMIRGPVAGEVAQSV